MEATNIVTVRIDASKPAGRKALRELEGKKWAKTEYPLPDEISENRPTHKEVFSNMLDRLSIHYGVDMHQLSKHEI